MHWKDVILGLLTFYFTLSLLTAYLVGEVNTPDAFRALSQPTRGNTMIAILLAIAAGVLAWWFSKKSSREYFKSESEAPKHIVEPVMKDEIMI